jgi:hypothetical protein
MTLVLHSPALRCAVAPDRGLSLTSLTGPSGDEWLMYDPARGPAAAGPGAAYDDVWRGGFEELFPSDAPGPFDGRELPDHGELWRSPFAVTEQGEQAVAGTLACASVPATVRKRVALDPARPAVALDYAITNTGAAPLRFLFKLHAALRVEGEDRVELPGGTVTAVTPGFGALASDAPRPWPAPVDDAGRLLDLSRVRPREARFREFVYVRDMPAGWCGVARARTGERLRLTCDRAVFPECWLFITYGGWRDYHTIVLEPCTNWPKDLSEAAARGRCAVLAPGATLATRVTVEIAGRDG